MCNCYQASDLQCLNPFKIRVPSEWNWVAMWDLEPMSQSLQDQGTVRMELGRHVGLGTDVSIPSRSGYRQNFSSHCLRHLEGVSIPSRSGYRQNGRPGGTYFRGQVSIPSRSGYRQNQRRHATRKSGVVSIPSRSGYRQNYEVHLDSMILKPSQSLQDQGTVRMIRAAFYGNSCRLNPFKIRVPSEFWAEDYFRELESQSLQDQGTVRIAVFRQTPVRVTNPSSENSPSVVF